VGLQSWLHGGVFGVQVMAAASRANPSRPRKMEEAFILRVNMLISGDCVGEMVDLDIEGTYPEKC